MDFRRTDSRTYSREQTYTKRRQIFVPMWAEGGWDSTNSGILKKQNYKGEKKAQLTNTLTNTSTHTVRLHVEEIS